MDDFTITGWAMLVEVGTTGANYRTGLVLLSGPVDTVACVEDVVAFHLEEADDPNTQNDNLRPLLKLLPIREYEPIELTPTAFDTFLKEFNGDTF